MPCVDRDDILRLAFGSQPGFEQMGGHAAKPLGTFGVRARVVVQETGVGVQKCQLSWPPKVGLNLRVPGISSKPFSVTS